MLVHELIWFVLSHIQATENLDQSYMCVLALMVHVDHRYLQAIYVDSFSVVLCVGSWSKRHHNPAKRVADLNGLYFLQKLRNKTSFKGNHFWSIRLICFGVQIQCHIIHSCFLLKLQADYMRYWSIALPKGLRIIIP